MVAVADAGKGKHVDDRVFSQSATAFSDPGTNCASSGWMCQMLMVKSERLVQQEKNPSLKQDSFSIIIKTPLI